MNIKEKADSLIKNVKADKKVMLILVSGIIGISLLVLSEVMPHKEDDRVKKENINTDRNEICCQYEENTEKRLEALLSSINGAGQVKVMVTVESGDESVYATDDKRRDNSDERGYVIVKQEGDDEGLLLKVLEPQIRGVAIVCAGADSAAVRKEIIGTVTAVLGISSNRVSIAKMRNSGG